MKLSRFEPPKRSFGGAILSRMMKGNPPTLGAIVVNGGVWVVVERGLPVLAGGEGASSVVEVGWTG